MFNGVFDSAETIVFWDIQGCPIPDDMEARSLSVEISLALKNMGYSGRVSFRAVGDDEHREFEGFHLVYVPEEAKDEQRRLRTIVDLFGYVLRNPWKPFNFVLIMGEFSGEMDIVRTIHLLKKREIYNVLLAQPHNASGQLGSEDWLKASLSAGNDLITPKITSDDGNMAT